MPEESSLQTEAAAEKNPPTGERAASPIAKQPKTKAQKQKLWAAIITGSIIVLGGLSYAFQVPKQVQDWYNTTSVTLKVKESDKFVIEGAKVVVNAVDYTTDSTGKVTIPSIVAGSYQITITKDGYKQLSANLSVVKGNEDIQFFSLEKETEKLFSLKGSLANSITKAPLVDGAVTLGGQTVQTNAAGEYQFSNLKPGEQVLSITKQGFLAAEVKAEITTEDLALPQTGMTPVGNVYFLSNRTGKRAIYKSNFDGSAQAPLVAPIGNTEDFDLNLSPNSEFLTFSSTREGGVSPFGGELTKLFVVGTDGKNLRKVSDDYAASQVVWSPTSAFFYFSAYKDDRFSQAVNRFYNVSKSELFDIDSGALNLNFSTNSDRALYTVIANGSAKLQVVNPLNGERKTLIEKAGYIDQPTWVDNDAAITYIHTSPENVRKYYKVTVNEGNEVEVQAPKTTTTIKTLVSSPNGKVRVFIADRDGKKDLFSEDAAGKNEKRLTTIGVLNQRIQPRFDTTGQYVIFAISKENETALYIVGLEGGTPQKITDFFNDPSMNYGR